MPCNDGMGAWGSTSSSYDRTELDRVGKKLDLVTRIACKTIGTLLRNGIEPNLDAEEAVWWENHKIIDAKRIAAERRAAEKAAKIQAIKQKLSAEELKLLGVK